jgi:hypothetical protein
VSNKGSYDEVDYDLEFLQIEAGLNNEIFAQLRQVLEEQIAKQARELAAKKTTNVQITV